MASPDITVVSCAAVDAVVSNVISAGGSAVARVSVVVAFLAALLMLFMFLASLLLVSALPLPLLLWSSLLLLASLMLLAYLQLLTFLLFLGVSVAASDPAVAVVPGDCFPVILKYQTFSTIRLSDCNCWTGDFSAIRLSDY